MANQQKVILMNITRDLQIEVEYFTYNITLIIIKIEPISQGYSIILD